jgi:hypothetical protein
LEKDGDPDENQVLAGKFNIVPSTIHKPDFAVEKLNHFRGRMGFRLFPACLAAPIHFKKRYSLRIDREERSGAIVIFENVPSENGQLLCCDVRKAFVGNWASSQIIP